MDKTETGRRIALRPVRYASVSGGKDSLYMLLHILQNQSKYPLDMVVNFDLEIDWPFTKECVSKIEELCSKAGILFWRIRPRRSFYDYFARYGMPGFGIRWCNNLYKLDAKRQLHSWLNRKNVGQSHISDSVRTKRSGSSTMSANGMLKTSFRMNATRWRKTGF